MTTLNPYMNMFWELLLKKEKNIPKKQYLIKLEV